MLKAIGALAVLAAEIGTTVTADPTTAHTKSGWTPLTVPTSLSKGVP